MQWGTSVRRALAAVAVSFGIVTIAAGGRVLGGADPRYVVFRPLLLYNTAMGAVYLLAGLLMWRGAPGAPRAAAAIVVLNALVLVAVAALYVAGRPIAVDSLRAMAFRTVVWVVLGFGLWFLERPSRGAVGR
jgi:hypothetical protein